MSRTKRYLSPTAVARHCSAGHRTVRRAIEIGELPAEVEVIGPNGTVVAIGVSYKAMRAWQKRRAEKRGDWLS